MNSIGSASTVLPPADQSSPSLELLLRNLPGAVYRCRNDQYWTMFFISEGIEKLIGYSPDAFTLCPSLAFSSLIHPDDRDYVAHAIKEAIDAERPFELTYRLRGADGRLRWIREQGAVSYSASDGAFGLEGFMSDVTPLQSAAVRMKEQASFLQQARDAIVAMDLDSCITYWNNGAERLYGWSSAEALGKNFCELICEEPLAYFDAYRWTQEHGEWCGELVHTRRDGVTLTSDARWTLFTPDRQLKTPAKILMISTDISERKRTEIQLHRLAFFDPLTGLPNRVNLLDHLYHAVVGSARTRMHGAVLFCDLDKFKLVNDTEGHATGDNVLRAVASRLKHCVREADMVARLSGDEFVVLLLPTESTKEAAAVQAEAVATKIVGALASPVRIADHVFSVSISVGIKILCGVDDTVESALGAADAAMYQAKACGRSTFRFHDPAIQAAWAAKAELEHDLRRALKEQEFILHYQPQLNADHKVVGAEALLRWRLPNGKVVFPAEFIGVAEESDLIVDIGKWVLQTACAQLASWQSLSSTAGLALSVNVSARQFVEPGFAAMLDELFEQTGIDPARLKLELTESLMIRDFERTAQTMFQLKKRGLCFSLDDFGTGYSSLVYLSKLPLDQLKIDYYFVRDVLIDKNNAAIVRSIIALGANLGLQVIAEGVETLGQQEFLSEAGCMVYQGYLYNRALNPEQFTQYACSMH
jgi:diguanylate cyclase (GGDEF)-like protein/PAS domain S-box-containing protein